MTKVQIAAPRKDREKLLQFLQEEEVIHVEDTVVPEEWVQTDTYQASESSVSYKLARVQFVLEMIRRLRSELHEIQKRNWRNIFAGKPAATLEELEQTYEKLSLDDLIAETEQISNQLVESQARAEKLSERLANLSPWTTLSFHNGDLVKQERYLHRLLIITTRDEEKLREQLALMPTALWQEVKREAEKHTVTIYGELVLHRSNIEQLKTFLSETDAEQVTLTLEDGQTIEEASRSLQQELEEQEQVYNRTLEQGRPLLLKEKDVQFAYDALLHHEERERTGQRMAHFPHFTVITGWIPAKWLPIFTGKLGKSFAAATVEEIPTTEDEKPPVALHNRPLLQPFEAVTNIYGKPAYHEIDPSGPLALFFLISFGLALTDAGYGIVMMLGTYIAQKVLRLPRETRKMVRLFFFAGLFTTIIGALTGGWFGVTLEELPANAVTTFLLSMKMIDPVREPLTLLGIAFAFGVVQLLFAWVVRGYHHWQSGARREILLDDLPWITVILFLLLWAAAKNGAINPALAEILQWPLYLNAGVLVLTQGRQQKNPFLKFSTGLLSLYGLVSFLSDTLSYSRLLALGLATAIIGLVVNLIASMVAPIPFVGLLLAVVVLLVGHTFNLGINSLGAFIHSGRLQFVEFFPKFIEGGGTPYKPFGRVSRYVANPKEFM